MVVTRPKAQARPLSDALAKLGARVVAAPLIKIVPPSSFKRLDASLLRLADYDGVIFTSRNAVESVFARAKSLGVKLARPRKLFAVGTETAKALTQKGWRGAKTPKAHHGEALARSMGKVRGLKLLLPRAKVAGEALPRLLRSKGARLTIVEAYRTVVDRSSASLLKKESRNRIHAVTFSSGSAVEQFVKIFGKAQSRKLFKTARAVSIGPVTSKALRARGIRPDQAKGATARALAQAVVDGLS